MTDFTRAGALRTELRSQRRARGYTLRALADEIGVSFNTLSRVERGHLPDLKNFQRIVEWLEMPADAFLEAPEQEVSTPEAIARHLRADASLTREAASQIASLVEDMYERLAARRPLAVRLRSARTFTPQAAEQLADILGEMQDRLTAEGA